MDDMDYKVEIKAKIESLDLATGGERFSIPVQIKNDSGRDLLDTKLMYLSYHIYGMDGKICRWDNQRYKIQLRSGEEGTVIMEDTAPFQKGSYIIQIDIIQEGVEWYSAKGVACPSVLLNVLKNGSADRNDLKRKMEEQIRVEAEWKKILEAGKHDFYHPYVKLDPYKRSPLSAVILFTTKDETAVLLKIRGKTKKAGVRAKFPEYTTKHVIPVYGLYPNMRNTVQMELIHKNGNRSRNQIRISANELSDGFQNISLITYAKDEKYYADGFNFCYTGLENKGMKMAYDIHGDIRWYFSEYFTEQVKYISNSSVWVAQNTEEKTTYICEYNMMGRLQSVYYSPYRLHHDIQFSSNNTMLILAERKDVEHDLCVEIDLETGKILNINDYKFILQRTRNVSVVYSNADWLHLNSIVEHNGAFIVSGNTQSTVLKHDRKGKIKWMLGDPAGYGTYWKQFFLKPIGRKFRYPYNQHAVEALPDADGNPDTLDILLFDNGNSRNKCNHLDDSKHPLYSRIVHYRIDEKKMTVRQIWEYGKERPELFSTWRGDADRQKNGNVIGVFNVRQKNDIDGKNYTEHCVVVEVDRKKNVIWECYGSSTLARNSYQNYRIERKPFYGGNEKNIDLDQEVKIRLPDTEEEKVNASGKTDR